VYATKRVRPIFVEEPEELEKGITMKIAYDAEVDALSIIFRETTVTTKHLAEGIAADYDAQGRLAGIEILDALKRFGDAETLRQVVLEGIGPTATTK
jgi:YD repeat-containing protein